MRTFIKVSGIALGVLFIFWTIMRIVTQGDLSGVPVLMLAVLGYSAVRVYRAAREVQASKSQRELR